MKRMATILQGGQTVGVVHGPDACEQTITVNGRIWRFDHDEHAGPLWLRRDGVERKCQNPNRAVWKAWTAWEKRWQRRKAKSPNAKLSDRRKGVPMTTPSATAGSPGASGSASFANLEPCEICDRVTGCECCETCGAETHADCRCCHRCHGSGECALLSGIEWDYSGPDYGTCPSCGGTGRR